MSSAEMMFAPTTPLEDSRPPKSQSDIRTLRGTKGWCCCQFLDPWARGVTAAGYWAPTDRQRSGICGVSRQGGTAPKVNQVVNVGLFFRQTEYPCWKGWGGFMRRLLGCHLQVSLLRVLSRFPSEWDDFPSYIIIYIYILYISPDIVHWWPAGGSCLCIYNFVGTSDFTPRDSDRCQRYFRIVNSTIVLALDLGHFPSLTWNTTWVWPRPKITSSVFRSLVSLLGISQMNVSCLIMSYYASYDFIILHHTSSCFLEEQTKSIFHEAKQDPIRTSIKKMVERTAEVWQRFGCGRCVWATQGMQLTWRGISISSLWGWE